MDEKGSKDGMLKLRNKIELLYKIPGNNSDLEIYGLQYLQDISSILNRNFRKSCIENKLVIKATQSSKKFVGKTLKILEKSKDSTILSSISLES